MLDLGWEKDYIDYGAGLFVINVDPRQDRLPKQSDNGTYIGHEGNTYGFQSTQGFFPHMNLSMSVIVNVDLDWRYPDNMMCEILKIVYKYKGIEESIHCYPFE